MLLASLLVSGLLQAKSRGPSTPAPSPAAQAVQDPEAGQAREGRGPEPREDDAEARKRAMEQRHGGKPSEAYLRAKERILKAEAIKWRSKRPFNLPLGVPPPAVPGGSWVNLGPGSLDSGGYSPFPTDLNSGRLTAIVTDPTSASTLYVGTAGGGVWKCTNADLDASGNWTWAPITDDLPAAGVDGNLPVGDLAMDPDDHQTLYLGLGDPLGAGEARGFWITHDGGTTWASTQSAWPRLDTIRVLPLGSGVVLSLPDPGYYLMRSTDGGLTFTTIFPKQGQIHIYDVRAFSPMDLALIGTTTSSNGGSVLFMYSSDGGQTWSEAALDSTLQAWPGEPISGALACSRTGDGVGYAMIPDPTTGYFAKGLGVTTDKGHSWSFRASDQLFSGDGDGGQVAYNRFLTLDPKNSSHVFAGANLGTYRSLDGGRTWARMTNWIANGWVYSHADHHVAAWSQTGTQTLFDGNDGGLSIFRDPLRASIPFAADQSGISDPTFVDNHRNVGIVSYLAYAIGSTTAGNDPKARSFLLTGMQDNSHGTGLDGSTAFKLDPATGDGMAALIHPLDAHRALAASYGQMILWTDQFGSSKPTWTGIQATNNTTFFTSLVQIPTDPDGVLTCGADALFISHDFGKSFSEIPLTGLDPTVIIQRPAASPFSPQTFAFTSFSAPLGAITLDGGATWRAFGALPGWTGSLWDILFSQYEPDTLYLTTQDYALVSHLFRSTDLGATWTALDGSESSGNGYPFGIPANVIRESPVNAGTLYVGTDLGVYVSADRGTSWTRLGTGLPFLRVEDLYLAPDGTFLRAATYGRGIWEIPLSTAGSLVVSPRYFPSGIQGASYAAAFSASGGTQPYHFTLSAGALPPGLSLSGDGSLSGTPTQAGAYTFSVTCQDSTSGTALSATHPYGLTISPPIQVVLPMASVGLLTGRSATFSAQVENSPQNAVTWTASGGQLTQGSPTEATFLASAPGVYTLVATAAGDPTKSATLSVEVHGDTWISGQSGPTGLDALYLIGRMGGTDLSSDLDGNGGVDQADLDILLAGLGW